MVIGFVAFQKELDLMRSRHFKGCDTHLCVVLIHLVVIAIISWISQ